MSDRPSSDVDRWIEAGCPEPTAAEEADEGECDYCGNPADYRVEIERQTTMLTCGTCSRSNRVHAQDVLDADVTVEVDRDE